MNLNAPTLAERGQGLREFLQFMELQVDSLLARLDKGEDPDNVMHDLLKMAGGQMQAAQ